MPSLAEIRAERQRRKAEAERSRVRQDGERIRARCQTLAGFVREAWHVVEPNSTYVHGWRLDAICEHLETMKSLLTSVLWPAWEWGPIGRPSLRYLTSSYTEKYVKRDSRRMRDLVQSDWYRSLWPDVQLIWAGEASFANTNGQP